jgi:hypothetical protein
MVETAENNAYSGYNTESDVEIAGYLHGKCDMQ